MGIRLSSTAVGLSVDIPSDPMVGPAISGVEDSKGGVSGLRRVAARAETPNQIAPGAKIASTEQRIFRLPQSSTVAEALVGIGLAAGLGALLIGGAAPATREQRESARAVARLLRESSSREAAGLEVSPASPGGSDRWAALSSVVLASVALGGLGRTLYRRASVSRSLEERQRVQSAVAEALESPFRAVRLKALQSIVEEGDSGFVSVERLESLVKESDPAISSLAKRAFIRHPKASIDGLLAIARGDRFQAIRMAALEAIEAREVGA